MNTNWLKNGTVLTKVQKNHLAFLRGYLSGLDIEKLGRQYLESVDERTPDVRVMKSHLRWIRDQLLMAARRRGRDFRDVRLIQIDPEKFEAPYSVTSMTLEQYREERDPHEMYSENELLALFREEFGGKIDRRIARNERLRRRQLAALSRLEELLNADPTLDDAVDGWLASNLASRLQAVGVLRLRDLVSLVNRRGYRWWVEVPRIGEKAAAQITRWLNSDYVRTSLGVNLNAHVVTPVRQLSDKQIQGLRPKSTGIVPMEWLIVPDELSGEHGRNRGKGCLIAANNDLAAIHEWLQIQKPNKHTRRAYQREAERYLLWSVMEMGRPISDHTSADCVSYRTFLSLVGKTGKAGKAVSWPFRLPMDSWIGDKSADRWSPAWKPFAGPLSDASQHHALVIVRALCKWLHGRRYLDSNPWDGVPKNIELKTRRLDRLRSFSVGQWKILLRYMETLPKDPSYDRLRFILYFTYGTGLRASELATATWKDLQHIQDTIGDTEAYIIHVVGKGSRAREVTIPSRTMREVHRYASKLGIASSITWSESTPPFPLIGRLTRKGKPLLQFAGKDLVGPYPVQPSNANGLDFEGITTRAIFNILKEFFRGAAAAIDYLDPNTKRAFERASMHWLRHTCGTHAIAHGVPLEIVQTNFGHRSPQTTAAYIEQDAFTRIRAMNSFMDAALDDEPVEKD